MKVYLIEGVSGAGKTTVCEELQRNEEKFNSALKQAGEETVFVCGGAMNKLDFMHHFTKVFTLHLHDQILKDRLVHRTNNDYGKKPDELAYQLKVNQETVQHSQKNGAILIDATKPLYAVIDEILSEID